MKMEKCPVCGKRYQVITSQVIGFIRVLKCPLITDLIYLDGVVFTKSARELIKESLGL